MAFMIGTVQCKCTNTMGMPLDSGVCTVPGCDAKHSTWGEMSLTRLELWAKEHSLTHEKGSQDVPAMTERR